MDNIKELVKRKKRENFILYLLLMFFCILNIVFNINLYKNVLFNNYAKIETIKDLNKDNKFMSIDLSNANKENYNIDFPSFSAHIYTLNLNDQNILIILKDNTLITDNIIVEKYDNDELINDIKLKFIDNKYYDISLSNINYNNDRTLELYKVYLLSILLILSFILAIKNMIQMLRPNKTIMYKRYIKKYNVNY